MRVGTEVMATGSTHINDGIFDFLIGPKSRHFPELYFLVQNDIAEDMIL